MLTALRGLKLKTLSVNPTLGLRGDDGKWWWLVALFSLQKRSLFLNVFRKPRVEVLRLLKGHFLGRGYFSISQILIRTWTWHQPVKPDLRYHVTLPYDTRS